MTVPDVIVIGAGSAGLAAATEAARKGLRVLLLDEQQSPGGQIYRAVEENIAPIAGARDVLGADYWRGRTLIDDLRRSDVEYVPGATVWTVEKQPLTVGYVKGERAFLRSARFIIVATGAYERPVPVPGWTLPGIMPAGAAQILMKAEGALLSGRIVMAGSGPLHMLVASQLLASGADLVGFLETTSPGDYFAAAPYLAGAMRSPRALAKGLAMRRAIRRSGVPAYSGVTSLRCEGGDKFTAIRFESRGRTHRIDADLLLLHQGIVPNVQITRALGLDHEWVETQRYWRPKLSRWGESSDERILVAGDGGGIDGALAAEAGGRIAALCVAAKLGAVSEPDRDMQAAPFFARQKQQRRIRPLLDHLYRPAPEIVCPSDPATIVCRCEEVDVQDVRSCIEIGCDGPNQLKAYSRCGMGPCQGRMCGLTVSEIMARERGVSVAAIGYYRIRPPIKPIPLSALASLDVHEDVNAP